MMVLQIKEFMNNTLAATWHLWFSVSYIEIYNIVVRTYYHKMFKGFNFSSFRKKNMN